MKLKIKPTIDELIKDLPNNNYKRTLILRYGLDGKGRHSLQKIGDELNLTRERIRQIEGNAITAISRNKNRDFLALQKEIKSLFKRNGEILLEKDIHSKVNGSNKAKDYSQYNGYVNLLLNSLKEIEFVKENNSIKGHWATGTEVSGILRDAFKTIHKQLKDGKNRLYSKSEIEEILLKALCSIDSKLAGKAKKHKSMWLNFSMKINMNPYGEWGSVEQPEISLKNLNSYARLVLRHADKPLHFTDIADRISKLKGSDIYHPTCHNELVRANDFVNVGRGLYSIEEHGCRHGTTSDIIECVLKESRRKSMSKEDILEEVKKEKRVKDNTILRALNNKNRFRLSEDQKYSIVSV